MKLKLHTPINMLQKPNLATSVYILLSTPTAYKQTHPQTVCVGQKH